MRVTQDGNVRKKLVYYVSHSDIFRNIVKGRKEQSLRVLAALDARFKDTVLK